MPSLGRDARDQPNTRTLQPSLMSTSRQEDLRPERKRGNARCQLHRSTSRYSGRPISLVGGRRFLQCLQCVPAHSAEGSPKRRYHASSDTPSTDQTVSNVSVPQRSWYARRSRRCPSRPVRRRTCACGLDLAGHPPEVSLHPISAHFEANPPDSLSVSLKS
jgi:hypothetical protein